MNTIKLASAVATLAVAGSFATLAYAKSAPCEDKLAELRAAAQDAKLGDADMGAVKRLEAKGVERCDADDDKRANAFFADAMKILKP